MADDSEITNTRSRLGLPELFGLIRRDWILRCLIFGIGCSFTLALSTSMEQHNIFGSYKIPDNSDLTEIRGKISLYKGPGKSQCFMITDISNGNKYIEVDRKIYYYNIYNDYNKQIKAKIYNGKIVEIKIDDVIKIGLSEMIYKFNRYGNQVKSFLLLLMIFVIITNIYTIWRLKWHK